jgi:ribosomal protein L24E
MHSSSRFPDPVIYPVKSNKEVASDGKIFQRKCSKSISVFKAQKNLREINKVLKVKTKTVTDSITVNG